MTRLRLLFSEALRSITANLSTTAAAVVTVLIGMFLLGVFIGLGTWVVSWSDNVKKELVVKVFFTENATKTQINALGNRLEKDPRVKSIAFVSKQRALAEMQKKYPQLTENLPANPLPASFEITPKKGEDTEPIALGIRDGKVPGVDEVKYGKETSRRILQIARAIQVVFLIAVIILLVASTILIANTIRLSIFARRREIEVMKLVGATNWFVRGPFMLEGLLTGFAGSLSAILLLLLSREIAVPQILGHIRSDPDVRALAFSWTAAILLAVGLGIGALGSGMTLRRFLRV
ncbi:MAG TPA: permease-like cell division protein FtsX [Gaiellaceae bacterium]|nr:permease-like cell division protein FtsX [Gaiellaceae bacterium]